MLSMALSLCRKELQADGGGALGSGFLRSGGWGGGGNVEEEVDRRPEGEGEGPRSSVVVEEVAKSPVPQEPRVSPVSRSRRRWAEEGGGR